MTLLKSGKAIEAGKDYAVSGWASINQATQGPPIWEVISNYLARVKTVRAEKADAVKVVGA
jgi:sulfur-oxidizing protein SoxB